MLDPFRQYGAKAGISTRSRSRLSRQAVFVLERGLKTLYRQETVGGMAVVFVEHAKGMGMADAQILPPLHMKGCHKNNQKKGNFFKHCVPFQ